MKKLPIGLQDFEGIINSGYLYVDKTELIYKLISAGKYYFLSRPRRFGKSLLLSTLEQIFKGNRELFNEFSIYEKIDWDEYPVIKIDFNDIMTTQSKETFQEELSDALVDLGKGYNINLTKKSITAKMKELIISLSKINKVVILVDEYDKPIVDYLTDIKKAKENRDILRQLYAPIKGLDRYIKFVFLTGVSRFAGLSVFSGLNNLNDITFNKRYNSICGITENEVVSNFSNYIKKLSDEQAKSIEQMRDKMKRWYNGYSWDGRETVYNPFSLLKLFDSNEFRNYWFKTGTPTFLMDLFSQSWTDIAELEKIDLDSGVIDSYDIGQLKIMPLLLQTGYLTVKGIEENGDKITYHLGYPNHEVRESMINNLMMVYGNMGPEFLSSYSVKLKEALVNADMNSFIKEIQSIFSGIPGILQNNQKESYFHSMFYLILKLMDADIDLEVLTDKGRIDAVLELNDKIFIIEFKVGEVNEAMSQIKEKKYYERYLNQNKDIYLLGVGGFEKKDIKCLLEKIG